MDFADAMKLVLGGVPVRRRAWTESKNPCFVHLHGNAVIVEDKVGVGPYEPGSNDMLATDWQAVSTGPTEQLVLRGLGDAHCDACSLPKSYAQQCEQPSCPQHGAG